MWRGKGGLTAVCVKGGTYSWVEDIDGLYSGLASLFVAKHQIHPLMKALRHKITLQSLHRQHIKYT